MTAQAPNSLLKFEYKIEMSEERRSLWEQFDSEVEPWRRGRAVLISIAVFNLILQALFFAAEIILGNVERLFTFGTAFVAFWLQFYFIWIGVHWIRWIAGGWSGLTGFCLLIWGLRDSNGYEALFGCINLLIGSYLCLSSSVYFFARRQREKRNWTQSLIVGAVLGLLFLSSYIGSVGLFGYKAQLQSDACSFANQAFAHIFTDHDTYFFVDHVSERALMTSGGREGATRFLSDATIRAGDVHDLKRATGQLAVTYVFPAKFGCVGMMASEGLGDEGPIELHMKIVEFGEGWQIEDVWWRYRDQSPAAR